MLTVRGYPGANKFTNSNYCDLNEKQICGTPTIVDTLFFHVNFLQRLLIKLFIYFIFLQCTLMLTLQKFLRCTV